MTLPALSPTDVAAWAALALAGFNTISQWRMASNDSKRMRRQPPVLELSNPSSHEDFPGWDACVVTIRNMEGVSVELVRLLARPKSALLIHHLNGSEPDKYGGRDPSRLRAGVVGQRSLDLRTRLAPMGTSATSQFGSRDTTTIALLTRNIRGARDLRLDWHWSDGQNS